LSGAAGGNAAGKVLGSLNQGTLINSIAGVVGGGLGGTIRCAFGAIDLTRAAGLDFGTIICQVVGGGAGGSAVLALVGVFRNVFGK
jgi:uncharacterized membrane protein YeaQ/YmgE (transglycosylase-associated protein family)